MNSWFKGSARVRQQADQSEENVRTAGELWWSGWVLLRKDGERLKGGKVFRFGKKEGGGLENIPCKDTWIDEKKFGKQLNTAVLDVDCCRQDVEGHEMGLGGSRCGSLCSTACRIFLEKHIIAEEQKCTRDEVDKMATLLGAP